MIGLNTVVFCCFRLLVYSGSDRTFESVMRDCVTACVDILPPYCANFGPVLPPYCADIGLVLSLSYANFSPVLSPFGAMAVALSSLSQSLYCVFCLDIILQSSSDPYCRIVPGVNQRGILQGDPPVSSGQKSREPSRI